MSADGPLGLQQALRENNEALKEWLVQQLQDSQKQLLEQQAALLTPVSHRLSSMEQGPLSEGHLARRLEEAEARAVAAEAKAAKAMAELQRLRNLEAELQSLRASFASIREAAVCPILRTLWKDPVVASDGQTYERKALEVWLKGRKTSPLTRELLSGETVPNRFAEVVVRCLSSAGMGTLEDFEFEASLIARQESEAVQGDVVFGPLLEKIRQCEEEAAMAMLRQQHLPELNLADDFGRTVLHSAISHGLVAVALKVLERTDFYLVNAKGWGGWTALHFAAYDGLLSVCQAIVERSDFTELKAVGNGRTALECAQVRGHQAVAEFLEAAERRQTPSRSS